MRKVFVFNFFLWKFTGRPKSAKKSFNTTIAHRNYSPLARRQLFRHTLNTYRSTESSIGNYQIVNELIRYLLCEAPMSWIGLSLIKIPSDLHKIIYTTQNKVTRTKKSSWQQSDFSIHFLKWAEPYENFLIVFG